VTESEGISLSTSQPLNLSAFPGGKGTLF